MESNGDSTYLYNIPPLKHDGSNYAAWKFRQRAVLRLHGLYDVVTGAEPMPDTHGETDASKVKAIADWTRRDMDAFAQIIQNMEDGALVDVVECKTAHEAWTCITQRWERNKAESLFDLCQQLTNTKIGEDEELTPALNNLRSIASRMEMLGEPCLALLSKCRIKTTRFRPIW